MDTLLDKVPTPDGDVIVTTKTKFLYFFNRPHTSVMPYGFSEFKENWDFRYAIIHQTLPFCQNFMNSTYCVLRLAVSKHLWLGQNWALLIFRMTRSILHNTLLDFMLRSNEQHL